MDLNSKISNNITKTIPFNRKVVICQPNIFFCQFFHRFFLSSFSSSSFDQLQQTNKINKKQIKIKEKSADERVNKYYLLRCVTNV